MKKRENAWANAECPCVLHILICKAKNEYSENIDKFWLAGYTETTE